MALAVAMNTTFLESWATNRFSNRDHKVIHSTIKQIQEDISHPGLSFEPIRKHRNRGFWSVKVNRNIRVIIHRSRKNNLLCYVGRHDDAYNWAENRRALAVTENTITLVEGNEFPDEEVTSREERVELDEVQMEDVIVEEAEEKNFAFRSYTDKQLLDFGMHKTHE